MIQRPKPLFSSLSRRAVALCADTRAAEFVEWVIVVALLTIFSTVLYTIVLQFQLEQALQAITDSIVAIARNATTTP